MNGLEAIERIRKAQCISSIVMMLSQEDTETIEAINIVEKELKAFYIIFKGFMSDPIREFLINATPEDFKETYRTKGEEVRAMYTEEEYIYVLTVLKEMVLNEQIDRENTKR